MSSNSRAPPTSNVPEAAAPNAPPSQEGVLIVNIDRIIKKNSNLNYKKKIENNAKLVPLHPAASVANVVNKDHAQETPILTPVSSFSTPLAAHHVVTYVSDETKAKIEEPSEEKVVLDVIKPDKSFVVPPVRETQQVLQEKPVFSLQATNEESLPSIDNQEIFVNCTLRSSVPVNELIGSIKICVVISAVPAVKQNSKPENNSVRVENANFHQAQVRDVREEPEIEREVVEDAVPERPVAQVAVANQREIVLPLQLKVLNPNKFRMSSKLENPEENELRELRPTPTSIASETHIQNVLANQENVPTLPATAITSNEDPAPKTPILTPGQNLCFSTPLAAHHDIVDAINYEIERLVAAREQLLRGECATNAFRTPKEAVLTAVKQEMLTTDENPSVETKISSPAGLETNLGNSVLIPPKGDAQLILGDKLMPSVQATADSVVTLLENECVDGVKVQEETLQANSAKSTSESVDKTIKVVGSSEISSNSSAEDQKMPSVDTKTSRQFQDKPTHDDPIELCAPGDVQSAVDDVLTFEELVQWHHLLVRQASNARSSKDRLVQEVNVSQPHREDVIEQPKTENRNAVEAEPEQEVAEDAVPDEEDTDYPLRLIKCPEARLQPFPQVLQQNLEGLGLHRPRQIQRVLCPILMTSKHIMVQTESGTGKSTAAAMALVHRAYNRKSRHDGRGPLGVWLLPTHEACQQAYQLVQAMAANTDISILCTHGHSDKTAAIVGFLDGADLLIATSGRFKDHLEHGDIRIPDIELLVIDEADRMCPDSGTKPAVETLLRVPDMKKTMQIALILTTFNDSAAWFHRVFNYDEAEINVGGGFLNLNRKIQVDVEKVKGPAPKMNFLTQRLKGNSQRTLVFVSYYNSGRIVESLSKRIGEEVLFLKNEMSPEERNNVLDKFQAGEHRILVLIDDSDSFARGLNFNNVDYVISDVPKCFKHHTARNLLVHRLGTVGRVRRGFATILIDSLSKPAEAKREVLKLLEDEGQEVPDWLYSN